MLDDFQIIVNKYISDASLPTTYELAKRYGHPYVSKVGFSKFALQAERDRKLLSGYSDKTLEKDVHHLTQTIMTQMNLDQIEETKKGSKRLFFLRGGMNESVL